MQTTKLSIGIFSRQGQKGTQDLPKAVKSVNTKQSTLKTEKCWQCRTKTARGNQRYQSDLCNSGFRSQQCTAEVENLYSTCQFAWWAAPPGQVKTGSISLRLKKAFKAQRNVEPWFSSQTNWQYSNNVSSSEGSLHSYSQLKSPHRQKGEAIKQNSSDA